MACVWVLLASQTTAERLCGEPGHPYCPEHQREIDAMEKSDTYWEEILASLRAVCEEPNKEQKLCAVCNRRQVHTDCPVHDDCVYCDVCCADDPLNLRGPQG
jgi:hypothetical protein